MKSPAFQFYPKDWLSESRITRMSFEAQGAYLRILCHMWNDSKNQCSISSDPFQIGRILLLLPVRTSMVLEEIQWKGDPIFIEKGGKFISKRLQRVKREQVKYSNAKSKAGKLGAQSRWHSHDSATALPQAKNDPTSTTTPPTPSPNKQQGRGKSQGGGGVFVMSEKLKELVTPGANDFEGNPMAAYEILTELGMKRGHRGNTWKLGLKYPLARIKEVARMCVGKRNAAGFAVEALEKGWTS